MSKYYGTTRTELNHLVGCLTVAVPVAAVLAVVGAVDAESRIAAGFVC
jgi:hypothetical protein